ncbi:MAG: hypothetical protein GXC76_01560 [Rhodanobacteraceae bacterium]|jgi:hypothetical protein|nr:hypothetical protein [Rhodanobacteraceae bacterium]
MKVNYVLIDFENIQPSSLELLEGEHFHVKLFVGASQTKLSIDLAAAMQRMGDRAEYVRISGNGRNALDFHIAYHIGWIARQEGKSAFFHIISKDGGFDPLIAHLKSQGIFARRSASLEDVPLLKPLTDASKEDQVSAVIERLRGMPKNRPQKDKTLRAAVSNWFGKNLDEPGIDRIVAELVKRKSISIDDGKVKYHLSA